MEHYIMNNTPVEAVLLTHDNIEEVAQWCDGYIVDEQDALNPDITYVGINLDTTFGRVRCSEGQVIVRDPHGFRVFGFLNFTRLCRKVEDTQLPESKSSRFDTNAMMDPFRYGRMKD